MENVLYAVDEGIATLTLNRPQTRNALTLAALGELKTALHYAESDDTVHALILTGSGAGFSSGADLTEVSAHQDDLPLANILHGGLNTIVMQMRNMGKPVICAMNGVAAGAGASLTLAADFRLMSTAASYVFAAFARIGLIPDAGATYLLTQLVGPAKTLELVLLADDKNRIDAPTALALGLINRVVTPDDLLAEARSLAQKLAQTPSFGPTKQAIYHAADVSLMAALENEARVQEEAFNSPVFKQAVMQFLSKKQSGEA